MHYHRLYKAFIRPMQEATAILSLLLTVNDLTDWNAWFIGKKLTSVTVLFIIFSLSCELWQQKQSDGSFLAVTLLETQILAFSSCFWLFEVTHSTTTSAAKRRWHCRHSSPDFEEFQLSIHTRLNFVRRYKTYISDFSYFESIRITRRWIGDLAAMHVRQSRGVTLWGS